MQLHNSEPFYSDHAIKFEDYEAEYIKKAQICIMQLNLLSII